MIKKVSFSRSPSSAFSTKMSFLAISVLILLLPINFIICDDLPTGKVVVKPPSLNTNIHGKTWPRQVSYLPSPSTYRFTPDRITQNAYKTPHPRPIFFDRFRNLGQLNGAPRPPIISMVKNTTKIIVSNNSTLNPTKLIPQPMLNVSPKSDDIFKNLTLSKKQKRIIEDIYVDIAHSNTEKQEQIKQISKWMSDSNVPQKNSVSSEGPTYGPTLQPAESNPTMELISIVAQTVVPKETTKSNLHQSPHFAPLINVSDPEPLVFVRHEAPPHSAMDSETKSNHKNFDDDEYDSFEDNGVELSGTMKPPTCAQNGRHYCTSKEDYPSKIVIEVTRYYKWPLEKLFRDLRNQVMPKLANDNFGGLVCDSITRVVRPGWAKNTNNRWLVIINTETYQQYVTEVVCRHGSGARCNFIPPCYHATCKQRYNTQKLLVVDPWNPYKGPFLSEFLFPSCCICYAPGDDDLGGAQSMLHGLKFDGPHKTSPPVTEKMEL